MLKTFLRAGFRAALLGLCLCSTAVAAVTRPLGMRGVFYRVAGNRVNAIDGPSSLNLPPYDRWATKSPEDPPTPRSSTRRTAIPRREAIIVSISGGVRASPSLLFGAGLNPLLVRSTGSLAISEDVGPSGTYGVVSMPGLPLGD